MIKSIPLEKLCKDDWEQVGHKAANLGELIQSGYPVPKGVVLTVDSVHFLKSTAWSEETQHLLLKIYQEVNALKTGVAIRSSGIFEDSEEQSAAGQFATVLDINSPDIFLKSIQNVIDSGQDLSIIIQEMKKGEISGVVFTESFDPQNKNCLIIETVKGLGDKLVGGQVDADRIMISKATMNSISPSVHPIAEIAIQIEKTFDKPVDIEFTMNETEIWILQCRPITTLKNVPDRDEFDSPTSPDDYWTSHNIQEVLPGTICPLTCSFMHIFVDQGWRLAYKPILEKNENIELFGIFHNRFFINMSSVVKISERAFGIDGNELMDQYYGQKKFGLHVPNKDNFWRQLKFRLKTPWLIYNFFVALRSKVNKNIHQILTLENEFKKHNWAAMDKQQLFEQLQSTSPIVVQAIANHLAASANIGLPLSLLEKTLNSYSKNPKNDVNVLFSGLKNVESSQISLKIWNLSRLAKKQKLDPQEGPLAEFLKEHGHRCENEWDIQAPSWRMEPAPLLHLIAAYTQLKEDSSPFANFERTAERRIKLTKTLLQQLPFYKRFLFKWLLTTVQKNMAYREYTKSYAVRAVRLSEFSFLEISKRLENPNDIFFYSQSDIDAFLQEKPQPNLQKTLLQRKKTYQKNRYIQLPDIFQGHPQPMKTQISDDSLILQGYSMNTGEVTGSARVITHLSESGQLQPGEILVTQTLDAALTPLLAIASGVVVEIGGILSHGCIIAREFGLPGVINIPQAVSRIKTGDLLTVDGNRGVVIKVVSEKP